MLYPGISPASGAFGSRYVSAGCALSDVAARGAGIRGSFSSVSRSSGSPYPRSFIPIPTCVSTLHIDRKSTRLNSSHVSISYAVFCLKKKKKYTKIKFINRIIYTYNDIIHDLIYYTDD